MAYILQLKQNNNSIELPCSEKPTCQELIATIIKQFRNGMVIENRLMTKAFIFTTMQGITRTISEHSMWKHNDYICFAGLKTDAPVANSSSSYIVDACDEPCVFFYITLENDGSISEPSPIPLAYSTEYGSGTIIIMGKEWYEKNGYWADSPSLEKENDDSYVYNYYTEIYKIMSETGAEELEESYFANYMPIDALINLFAEKGYQLIPTTML